MSTPGHLPSIVRSSRTGERALEESPVELLLADADRAPQERSRG